MNAVTEQFSWNHPSNIFDNQDPQYFYPEHQEKQDKISLPPQLSERELALLNAFNLDLYNDLDITYIKRINFYEQSLQEILPGIKVKNHNYLIVGEVISEEGIIPYEQYDLENVFTTEVNNIEDLKGFAFIDLNQEFDIIPMLWNVMLNLFTMRDEIPPFLLKLEILCLTLKK